MASSAKKAAALVAAFAAGGVAGNVTAPDDSAQWEEIAAQVELEPVPMSDDILVVIATTDRFEFVQDPMGYIWRRAKAE